MTVQREHWRRVAAVAHCATGASAFDCIHGLLHRSVQVNRTTIESPQMDSPYSPERVSTGKASPLRLGSKGRVRTQLRPSAFAAYSAVSALWIIQSSDGSSARSGATPMLTVEPTVWPCPAT